jgi:cytochrome c biogenesis protein CcmG/thiol:disulfide interchange protein DsbE
MKSQPAIVAGAAIVILAIAALFFVALNLASQIGARPEVGKPAPDFAMTFLPEYQAGLNDGAKLSDLRGKVVVLNFWASWCVECRKESDALEAAHRKYQNDGVMVLGIDYLDTESPALAYLREFDITFPNAFDTQQKIARAYRITGVPETFFIDKQGIVRDIVIQPISEAQLNTTIDKLLAE